VEYVIQYVIQSYKTGLHTIPSIEIPSDTPIAIRTEPLEFRVFDPTTDLAWQEAVIAQQRTRYAIGFHLLKDRPYPGEAVPVEIKLYLSHESALRIDDWGIPEFERDGVACWRMEPSAMRGQLNMLGKIYIAVAYPSTMTATREGRIAIGPAKLRLTSVTAVADPLLGYRQMADEKFLDIPKLEFETTPLPPGAPAGFENAIGSFTLRATTSKTEVREGDPISVDLVVSGSGNLDTLRPPRLQDPKEWKTYEATSTQRGDERRQLSGSVVFQQLIKPLTRQTVVPPFRLAFFDPQRKEYRTLTTPAIPLQVQPVAAAAAALPPAPPSALPVPIEKMTDILATIQPSRLLLSQSATLPPWAGHAAGGLLAALLLARAAWLRLRPRLARNPRKIAEKRELAEVAGTPAADDVLFLKRAGAFIERRLGTRAAELPDLQAIITERDQQCFRADATRLALGKRRAEILKTLRKSLSVFLLGGLLLLAPGSARAEDAPPAAGSLADLAQTAYDKAEFEEAIRLWLSAGPYQDLAPDTLYNIGNACYRLGSPGYAALYYRRALVRDPGHAEARQNLRFIERKCGAITIQRPEYQYTLARIPLAAWQWTVWTGLWLAIIALLVFPATRTGAGIRAAAVAAIVLSPIIGATGLLGWHYYPDDATFAPVSQQAVVITDKLTVHTEATRTSPEVIEAPAGSLCQVIRSTGSWVYIAFASQTRGWVPADSVEPIAPASPPPPPRIRKPASTERSA
jgi:tetratricopeptide (TPR) repeat protein